MRASDVITLLTALGLDPYVHAANDIDRCEAVDVTRPEEAKAGSCSWLRPDRSLSEWHGSILIVGAVPDVDLPRRAEPWAIIVVNHPRRAMLHVLQTWFAGATAKIEVHESARIHPTAVIGASDAGYVWMGDRYQRFPHIGGVIIGEDVEIDPLAVVSRAAIGNTVIGRGSKIGPQVTVGHGARIGRDCILVSQACVTGSAVLGDRVMCWANCTIASGVRVGDGAIIGAGAVVLKDVPAGETWAGVPARRLKGADGN